VASLHTLSAVSGIISAATSLFGVDEDDAFTDRKGYFGDDDTLATGLTGHAGVELFAPKWHCGAGSKVFGCNQATIIEGDEEDWNGTLVDLITDDEGNDQDSMLTDEDPDKNVDSDDESEEESLSIASYPRFTYSLDSLEA